MTQPCKPTTGVPVVVWILLILLAAILAGGLWQVLGSRADAADVRGMGVFAPAKAAPKVNPYTTGPVTSGVPAVPTASTKAAALPNIPGLELGALLAIDAAGHQLLGGRLSIHLATLPNTVPLVGGRDLYADLLTVGEYGGVGLSGSLGAGSNLRGGACVWWREGEAQFGAYIGYPVAGLW
jgi:hypothetical protein